MNIGRKIGGLAAIAAGAGLIAVTSDPALCNTAREFIMNGSEVVADKISWACDNYVSPETVNYVTGLASSLAGGYALFTRGRE